MSKPDFKHLDALQVTAKNVVDFTFYNIVGRPKLLVSPAGQCNAGYIAKTLEGGKRALVKMRGDRISNEALNEGREQDRELYVDHVIKGWDDSTVLDAAGQPVKFSKDNCRAFLSALPDDIFDELRIFCSTADNFRGEGQLDSSDVKALGKNSQGGSAGS